MWLVLSSMKMTSDEQAVLKTGVEAALRPFSALMEKLFGGAVEEVGGMWQESLRARRIVRRAKLYARVQQMLDAAGLEPAEIPEKIWFPALQQASMEDDDSLTQRWAALLANASTSTDLVHPSFMGILAELSGADVLALDHLYSMAEQQQAANVKNALADTSDISGIDLGGYQEITDAIGGPSLEGTQKVLDNVLRLRLLKVEQRPVFDTGQTNSFFMPRETKNRVELKTSEEYRFSDLGADFVRACRPPSVKPASDG